MTPQGVELDPFGTTTDASAYVSRPACEEALTALQDEFHHGARLVALTGPSGIGKTQLLRVLGARLQHQADVLVLPYAGLEFDDLCFFALGLLGEEGDPAKAAEDLRVAAERRASEGRFLVLALDDASGLSKEAAEKLIDLTATTAGALRILVVPVDDPRAGRVLATLGKDLPEIRLSQAMTEEESNLYVKARLARRPPPPEIFGRFDAGALRWIHRESGGNPREVHHLCLMIQRGLVADSPDAFNRRGQWLEIEVGDVPTIETQDQSSDPPSILQSTQPIPIHPMPASPPVRGRESAVDRENLGPARKGTARKVGWGVLGLLAVAGLGSVMSSDRGSRDTPESLSPGAEANLDAASPASAPGLESGTRRPSRRGETPVASPSSVGDDAFPVETLDGLVRDLVGGEDPLSGRGEEGRREEGRGAGPPAKAREADAPSALTVSDPGSASSLTVRDPAGLPEGQQRGAVEDPTATAPVAEAGSNLGARSALGDQSNFEAPADSEAGLGSEARPEAADRVVEDPGEPGVAERQETQSPSSSASFPAALDATPRIQVNVNSDPWAKVQIDGRDVGITPLASVPLTPGVHVFRLTFADGHTQEAERTVDEQSRHFVFGE